MSNNQKKTFFTILRDALKDGYRAFINELNKDSSIKEETKEYERPIEITAKIETVSEPKSHVPIRYTEEDLRQLFLHSKGWTVTSRAKKAKQPRGGYLRPRDMKKIDLQLSPVRGIDELNPDEATNAGLVGMAVDYLTRVMIGDSVEEAFKISLLGAKIIKEEEKARSLISRINGLNKESVICAVKLSGFDVVYRAGRMGYRPVDEIIPDDATIDNIIIMVKRSQQFFKIFGPCVMSGFTFEGGYTDIIVNGDGDYLTPDTLVDFKVSKNNITTAQTLQILIYWRMGLHSIHSEFQNVKYLGIYNPKANILARISVDKISPEVIKTVEYDLIGYR